MNPEPLFQATASSVQDSNPEHLVSACREVYNRHRNVTRVAIRHILDDPALARFTRNLAEGDLRLTTPAMDEISATLRRYREAYSEELATLAPPSERASTGLASLLFT